MEDVARCLIYGQAMISESIAAIFSDWTDTKNNILRQQQQQRPLHKYEAERCYLFMTPILTK